MKSTELYAERFAFNIAHVCIKGNYLSTYLFFFSFTGVASMPSSEYNLTVWCTIFPVLSKHPSETHYTANLGAASRKDRIIFATFPCKIESERIEDTSYDRSDRKRISLPVYGFICLIYSSQAPSRRMSQTHVQTQRRTDNEISTDR